MSQLNGLLIKTLTDDKTTPDERANEVRKILELDQAYQTSDDTADIGLSKSFIHTLGQFSHSTAAGVAAVYNHVDSLKLLIKFGYDPLYALYVALLSKNAIDAVRYLLTLDFDIDTELKLEKTVSCDTELKPLSTCEQMARNQAKHTGNDNTKLLDAHRKIKAALLLAEQLPLDQLKKNFVREPDSLDSSENKTDSMPNTQPTNINLKKVILKIRSLLAEAFSLDAQVVLHYLARCLKLIIAGKRLEGTVEDDYPIGNQYPTEDTYPGLAFLTHEIFKLLNDENYQELFSEDYKAFQEIVLAEWQLYEPHQEGFLVTSAEKYTFISLLYKGNPPQQKFIEGLEAETSKKTTALPGGLPSSSPLNTASKNKPQKVKNYFAQYFELALKNDVEFKQDYTTCDADFIIESLPLLAKSLGVTAKIKILVSYTGAITQEPDFVTQLMQYTTDSSTDYVVIVAQTSESRHAVAALIDRAKQTVFIVDSERNLNDGETQAFNHLQKVYDTSLVFKFILTNPNKDTQPQGVIQQPSTDEQHCGFYCLINLGAMLYVQEKSKRALDPLIDQNLLWSHTKPAVAAKLKEIRETLEIDVAAAKLPHPQHRETFVGVCLLIRKEYRASQEYAQTIMTEQKRVNSR